MKYNGQKFQMKNKEHPAYGKYFTIRDLKINKDKYYGLIIHLLAEWCTWSNICTWISNDDLTNGQKEIVLKYYKD